MIVDDFKVRGGGYCRFGGSGGWDIFEANMKRALPGARFFEMSAAHPIYHAFFEINDLDIVPQAYVAHWRI